MADRGPGPSAKNTYNLETTRLQMTLPSEDDAEVIYHLVGGEHRREVCATLLWDGPDSIREVLDWVSETRKGMFGEGGFHWVIRDREGDLGGSVGAPLGAIATRPRDEAGRADVGYWLGRPYWGKGLMTEALRALLELGFTTLDFYKMEADVYTINTRGTRLVESVGMTREGIIRRAHRKYGGWVDVVVYGIMREEWVGATSAI